MNLLKYNGYWKIDGCCYPKRTRTFSAFCEDSISSERACGSCLIQKYRVTMEEWEEIRLTNYEEITVYSGMVLPLFDEES